MEFKNLIVNHYKHYIALQNCEVENYDEDKLQQLKSKHELERFEINNLIKDNENAIHIVTETIFNFEQKRNILEIKNLYPAKELIRTIKTYKGEDDCGLEHFIKSIE